ncbi:MAG: hypothetical protein RIB03_09375 [Henriciella sp.]|uniref:hypothetical protein n=1 Tax=Henriciella sp. TaxID=1968823 RepID=UPI0032EF778D
MLTREWIIAVLKTLPVWAWPIFFWDVLGILAWCSTEPYPEGTLVTLGVTWWGRIQVTAVYKPDQPDPCDWTRHAPRAPWADLDPAVIAAALEAFRQEGWKWAVSGTFSDCGRTLPGPAFMDSG